MQQEFKECQRKEEKERKCIDFQPNLQNKAIQ